MSSPGRRNREDGQNEQEETKKKTMQCGGMVWGPSRALGAALGNKRKKEDEIEFGDFGRYMSEKIRKLREQYQVDASKGWVRDANWGVAVENSVQGPLEVACRGADSDGMKRVFEGVSIYVDGFTIPSHQELRHLMIQHGGRFENYFDRSQVTHVICSTLPDSKIKDPRLLSRGLPILKPSWIVDSIKACKRLSPAGYELERIAYQHPHQRTLPSSFFASGGHKKPTSIEQLPQSSGQHQAILGQGKPNDDAEGHNLLQLQESEMDIGEVQHTAIDLNQGETELGKEFLPVAIDLGSREADSGVDSGPDDSLHRLGSPEKDLGAPCLSETNGPGFPGCPVTAANVSPKLNSKALRAHSTLGDPKFVQNFYKNSRLHFIGTWRTRYQELFGNKGAHEGGTGQIAALPSFNSSARPTIIHIDMDCFFVSVVVRNRPDLLGKPVAVCHSDSTVGTAEISSANYAAREYGIHAGMFVRSAKQNCPHLEIVPYDFEGYEQVAEQAYRILHQHSSIIQAISCDEAFLDVTGSQDPDAIATKIRKEIFSATNCTASAGIGGNMLLARLATKKAKPNGQYHILPDEVEHFISSLPVGDLPGVGWALEEKLKSQGILDCAKLRASPKESLQRDFGTKTGSMLWDYARGIDQRQVQPVQERKSLGAEVNWGVRFSCDKDAHHFLVTLCEEVCGRLQNAGVMGRTFTLKVKTRREGANEPVKFMGHGICDSISRSATVATATDSVDILLQAAQQLFALLNLDVRDVRGVGLQVTRLEGRTSRGVPAQRALESWLQVPKSPEGTTKGKSMCLHETEARANENSEALHVDADDMGAEPDRHPSSRLTDFSSKLCHSEAKSMVNQRDGLVTANRVLKASVSLPPISQLDRAVLACLPADIVSELQDAYNGKLGSSCKHSQRPSQQDAPAHMRCFPNASTSGIEAVAEGPKQLKLLGETSAEPSYAVLKPVREGQAAQLSRLEALPPASQLDQAVLSALPLALRRELEHEYKRLSMQVAESKPRVDAPVSRRPGGAQARSRTKAVEKLKGSRPPQGGGNMSGPRAIVFPAGESAARLQQSAKTSEFIPLSFTQVDKDVLNELPDDLKQEILQILPAHQSNSRKQAMLAPPDVAVSDTIHDLQGCLPVPEEFIQASKTCTRVPSTSDSSPMSQLWCGHPPKWVLLFEDESIANSAMLRYMAAQYREGQQLLSGILLALFSYLSDDSQKCSAESDAVAPICSEWVKQYSQNRAQRDLEDLHIVLRLIKRLASKSKLWETVQTEAIPALQVSVMEVYGGKLA